MSESEADSFLYSYVNMIQFFAAQQKECEEEISLKSDVISRLESKTEEISRLLIRLNDMPPGT